MTLTSKVGPATDIKSRRIDYVDILRVIFDFKYCSTGCLYFNLCCLLINLLPFQMDVDLSRGEGFRSYYIQKIEELQLVVADKAQNLRRLQAQRNELNAKGNKILL